MQAEDVFGTLFFSCLENLPGYVLAFPVRWFCSQPGCGAAPSALCSVGIAAAPTPMHGVAPWVSSTCSAALRSTELRCSACSGCSVMAAQRWPTPPHGPDCSIPPHKAKLYCCLLAVPCILHAAGCCKSCSAPRHCPSTPCCQGSHFDFSLKSHSGWLCSSWQSSAWLQREAGPRLNLWDQLSHCGPTRSDRSTLGSHHHREYRAQGLAMLQFRG